MTEDTQMQLFAAWYHDHMYPEDTYILGTFDTEEKAEAAIQTEMSIESNPRSHRKMRHYYRISEGYLNEACYF